MKNKLKKRLTELGFNTDNFDLEYENALDNYSYTYDVEDPEYYPDFEEWCINNWI